MRVKLEPETAFIGKKFAYIFLGIIFSLNAVTFIWFFLFSNFKQIIALNKALFYSKLKRLFNKINNILFKAKNYNNNNLRTKKHLE